MPRGLFGGFGRPPIWALVLILVGAVLLAVGTPYAAGRQGDALSPAETERLKAAVESAAASDAAKEAAVVHVLVIGDSYVGGSDEGGTGAAGWPRLVANSLIQQGYSIQLTVSAAGGSGYDAVGPSGESLAQLAQNAAQETAPEAAPDYDLIIFLGSRNDTAGKATVEAAATEAYTAVKATSPEAKLLVFGPPWINNNPPTNVKASRDGVAAAASAAGAAFVDPLDEGWFAGEFSDLIGSDGIHPTDAGHQHIADLILPRVDEQLVAMGAVKGTPGG